MPVRTVIERGPKGKRSVAFTFDWPGWSRGAKTAELALETLESYRERYRPVASLAGMARDFEEHAGARAPDGSVRYKGALVTCVFSVWKVGPRRMRRPRSTLLRQVRNHSRDPCRLCPRGRAPDPRSGRSQSLHGS